eukprot:TRINITY_DN878_c0_g1_i1.p1 TRINITY_DN878_c0_g1~~TRINITY_DN878_c0_g1_i1.p1  ORF type:complete len:571 (-),score=58.66 TRINITY_DN878_c0_g1_i1:329-2041(-)
MGIPRIFHQIWISRDNQPVPENWAAAHESWLRLHPTWGHHLWNDTSCRELIANSYSWFLHQWDKYTASPIQHADVCRYFVLHHHGGLYADLDIRPLANLDPALAEAEAAGKEVLFLEKEHGIFLTPTVSIGLMASAARSTFWLGVFKVLEERTERWFYRFSHHLQIIYGTGPLVVKTQIKRWESRAVGVFSAEHFYACDVCQPLPCHRDGGMVVFEPGGLIWNKADTKAINFIDCKILRPVLNPRVLLTLLALFYVLWHFPALLRFLRRPKRPLITRLLAFPRSIGSQIAATCSRFSWRQKAVGLLILTSLVANLTPLLILFHSSGQDLCVRNDRVLFVTAHPGDASWFFRPTISACRNTVDLHLLCLSSDGPNIGHAGIGLDGAHAGEADLRPALAALHAAAPDLGFRSVHILNETALIGKSSWDPQGIASAVQHVVALHDITAVVSFDESGVTRNPDHRAVHRGVRMAQHLPAMQGRTAGVRFYELQSVSLFRRFAGFVDIPLSVLVDAYGSEVYVSWRPLAGPDENGRIPPRVRVFLNRYAFLNTLAPIAETSPPSHYIKPLRSGMV